MILDLARHLRVRSGTSSSPSHNVHHRRRRDPATGLSLLHLAVRNRAYQDLRPILLRSSHFLLLTVIACSGSSCRYPIHCCICAVTSSCTLDSARVSCNLTCDIAPWRRIKPAPVRGRVQERVWSTEVTNAPTLTACTVCVTIGDLHFTGHTPTALCLSTLSPALDSNPLPQHGSLTSSTTGFA